MLPWTNPAAARRAALTAAERGGRRRDEPGLAANAATTAPTTSSARFDSRHRFRLFWAVSAASDHCRCARQTSFSTCRSVSSPPVRRVGDRVHGLASRPRSGNDNVCGREADFGQQRVHRAVDALGRQRLTQHPDQLGQGSPGESGSYLRYRSVAEVEGDLAGPRGDQHGGPRPHGMPDAELVEDAGVVHGHVGRPRCRPGTTRGARPRGDCLLWLSRRCPASVDTHLCQCWPQ